MELAGSVDRRPSKMRGLCVYREPLALCLPRAAGSVSTESRWLCVYREPLALCLPRAAGSVSTESGWLCGTLVSSEKSRARAGGD